MKANDRKSKVEALRQARDRMFEGAVLQECCEIEKELYRLNVLTPSFVVANVARYRVEERIKRERRQEKAAS